MNPKGMVARGEWVKRRAEDLMVEPVRERVDEH